jgi:2-oxoglutarate dehydrogenase E2 component (dihydrolipoamide succinyltransferase)
MDETGVDATAASASSSSAQPDTGTQQANTAPAVDTTATQPPTESTPRAPETEQPTTAAATSEPSSAAPATTPETAAAPVTKTTISGRSEERVKMTRLRQRVAERLLSAQHENAILTTFNEVNMKPVMDLRERYKEEFEKTHGVRLGFMSFFTKAAVEALKKFPVVNASVDGTDILYHNYFDIGIAVSSPRGLVVPIVRDADTLSLARVESTIRELGEKAQQATLTMEDLTGGTFTITNGGIFGSLLSTPILNPPQSAILGMHKIQERPVAEHGEVVIRPMMYLALSYDHRIIDGREAVQFLVTVKEQLEDPARLLLQI